MNLSDVKTSALLRYQEGAGMVTHWRVMGVDLEGACPRRVSLEQWSVDGSSRGGAVKSILLSNLRSKHWSLIRPEANAGAAL